MNYCGNDAIDSLYDRIWQLSPDYKNPASYELLKLLTSQLIDTYQENNRLESDPFLSTRDRKVVIHSDKLDALLAGQVCLITGGSGCVGSSLIEKLLTLNIKTIVVFDKNPKLEALYDNDRVVFVEGNICNQPSLQSCFNKYNPNFVFHTAAQRSPGYAEKNILEAIRDNVIGTLNVVKACDFTASVKQCVFSSTGKASRYYTSEVYAATKKLCEFIFDTHAKDSRVRYSMVRFTHIIDNSLMNNELKDVTSVDHLSIHSPGKYVTAQNVSEAACLMLNALHYAQRDRSAFLIVKNLEWPVESLEVALFHILKQGKKIPVIFKGNPLGYREGFFRGQLDWTTPDELNLLINVYENQHKKINAAQDIIIANILPVNKKLLLSCISEIENINDESNARNWLNSTLFKCVKDSLANVKASDTLNILKWGLDLNYLDSEISSPISFKETVELLLGSLIGTEEYKEAESIVSKLHYEPNTYQ